MYVVVVATHNQWHRQWWGTCCHSTLGISCTVFMRPSSLRGGRILRRTLSVRLSVCLSVCPSVPLSLPSVTSRHLANYNDTQVLFGTHWGPHIVRPSRPHKFLFNTAMRLWFDCCATFMRLHSTNGNRTSGELQSRRSCNHCLRWPFVHDNPLFQGLFLTES